jgi:hypothetical protein
LFADIVSFSRAVEEVTLFVWTDWRRNIDFFLMDNLSLFLEKFLQVLWKIVGKFSEKSHSFQQNIKIQFSAHLPPHSTSQLISLEIENFLLK